MGSSFETILTVFHILVAVTLIGLVLIQDSKSGAMGVLGTGNSNSLLGATGATSLAAKLTRWSALLFAVSCISLAMMSSRSDKSVLDGVPAAAATAPATTTPAAATPATQAPAAETAAPSTQTPAEKK